MAQQLPVARLLRDRGHEVSFAVPDLALAAERLGPAGFRYFMAPQPIATGLPRYPPANFSEVLLVLGFAREAMCTGLVQGWLRLMEAVRADVAITDFAPMAVIAAMAAEVPVVQLSSGFDLPPAASPLPRFRAGDEAVAARLLAADTLILKRINGALAALGRRPLERLTDFFTDSPTLLTTIEELDHYGPRSGGDYVGPIAGESGEDPVEWPQGGEQRILAYLRPTVPGAGEMLRALADTGAAVVCAMPGADAALCRRLESARLRVVPRAIPLESLLETADLACSYGGTGFTGRMLLAGVPVLIASQVVEQEMIARRVEELGAGIAVRGGRSKEQFAHAVAQLLERGECHAAARSVAARYAGRSLDAALLHCVSVIEDAPGRGRGWAGHGVRCDARRTAGS